MTLSLVTINADDFGMNSTVNRAILSSVEQGLVTSTSIMANMPGFEEAVGLVRAHDELRGRVGVHLNLTEGRPLSQPILGCRVFCGADGSFYFKRERPLFRLEKPVKAAAYEELRMQLQKVVEAGITPTHLDSHHHIHTEWAVVPLVRRLAKEFRIPRIRLTRNMGRQPNYLKRLYKAVFNRWQLGRHTGLNNTDLFGDIDDMVYHARSRWPEGSTIEIMVHPLFNEQGELVDLNRRPLQPQLAPILRQPLTLSPSKSELHS
jgi:chitin disaccharide deacetylase